MFKPLCALAAIVLLAGSVADATGRSCAALMSAHTVEFGAPDSISASDTMTTIFRMTWSDGRSSIYVSEGPDTECIVSEVIAPPPNPV